MFLAWPGNHVLYQLILGIKNDVSDFAEVLNHILILDLTVDDDLFVLMCILEHGVLYEFFDQWIYDSVVLARALRQPRPTRQTQRGVWIFEKVNHLVES
jgi:hypothetical protein